jgi:hypothetical protein
MLAYCVARCGLRAVWLATVVVGLNGTLLLVGCSGKHAAREDATTLELRQLAQAYESVQSTRHRPPKNIDELRQVLQEFHDARFGDPPDEVLTSNRDGLPYEIIFGLDLGAEVSHDIFIYEQKGAEGFRYAMTISRMVKQIPDGEFARQQFARGHRPGNGGP